MHYSTDSVSVCEHALAYSRLLGLCSLACTTVSTMKITVERPVFHPHHLTLIRTETQRADVVIPGLCSSTEL